MFILISLTMKRLIVFCFWVLGVSAGVLAQNQSFWEKIKSPDGGDILVTLAPNGVLYGQSTEFALYRSLDNGLHWERVSLNITPSSIFSHLSVGSSGNFYLSESVNPYHWQLFVSTNEGADWQLAKDSLPTHLRIMETASGALLTFMEGAIWRSDDVGHTWSAVSDVLTSNSSALDFSQMPNGDLLFYRRTVSAQLGAYISSNDGQSWALLSPTFPNYVYVTPSGTILFVGLGGEMRRSTDQGDTWALVTSLPPQWIPTSFCALPSGRLLGTGQGEDFIIFSDNDGETWQTLPPGNHQGSVFPLTTALPNGTVLRMYYNALYRSENQGETWDFSALGYDRGGVRAIKFATPDTVFATNGNGLHRSNDRCLTWERIMERDGEYDYDNAFAISNGRMVIIKDGSLLISDDWGETFEDFSPPDGVADTQVFFSDSLLLIPTFRGLIRSSNLGQTWDTLSPDKSFRSLTIHPSGRLYASFSDEARVGFSDDQGLTWDVVTTLPLIEYANVFSGNSGTIIVDGTFPDGQHYRFNSTNNGISWGSREMDFFVFTNAGRENAEGHIFSLVEASFKIYRSIDQGATWQSIPDLESLGDVGWLLGMDVSPDQFLYVGTQQGLYRTRRPTTEGAYLTGRVQVDADADCTTPDAQPTPSRSWSVKAEGENTWYGNTDSTGRYRMFIDTGAYQVTAVVPQKIWWTLCDSVRSVEMSQLLATDTADFTSIALSDCPLMFVDVMAPRLRRCFENPIFVQYCNQGPEPADSAWAEIEIDPYMTLTSAELPYESLGPKKFRFNLGPVQPGVCGQFSFNVLVDCDSTILGQTHCILAHAWPDTLCVPVNGWSGANIEAEAHCIGDSTVRLILRNTGTGASSMLEYIIIEDDIVLLQGDEIYDIGEDIVIERPAQGRTWRIESQQEPGHPFSNLAIAFTEGCDGFNSLGFINQFAVNGIRPAWDRFCLENTGAYDPNDKQGFPLGHGSDQRIRPGQDLEYLIRFQNTGTDTAFTVIIRDTLSTWLDAASVRPGAASHPYTWDLSGQGVLTFRFNNILLPDSNTNLAASQGFISFRVEQQPNVPLGTKIFNEASIYFDFNAPVITNQTLHTIGLNQKSSTSDLPPASMSEAVLISPNPVEESTVFRLREGVFQQHLLTLTDALGRTVWQSRVTGSHHVFNRKNLPAGVYAYRVEDVRGRLTGSGKVVLK